MANTYEIGDLVDLEADFKLVTDGSSVDPTTVVITVTDPNGNPTTPAVSNPSLGVFTATVAPTAFGLWRWKAVGTGAAQAAKYGSFEVRKPSF